MSDAVMTRLRFTEAGSAEAELAFVKQYLRVEHSEDDDLIVYLLDAAKDEADSYLNNDFDDGSVPTAIGRWVLETVSRSYEYRVAGMMGENVAGSGSVQLEPADYVLLDRYRLIPGV